MKRISQLIFVILLVQILSCAKQTTPTGGPKDTIPPNLIQSNPNKGQTNIKPKEIKLLFDETVILNNPKEQIIITPDIGKKYDIVAKNKTATITLDTVPQENTTYLINFRDAIQDISEKNPVKNLKLAFSTGTYIDSLKIEGVTYDLLNNKEYKDVTVALYQSDTFNIFKHKPQYITKSNDKGVYSFEYIKNGNYFLYALDDKNKNLLTDSKSESFAFKAQPIVLDKNFQNQNLNLIKLDSRPQKLTASRAYNTYSTVNFTKGLKQYRLRADNYDSIISTFGETRATLLVYNTFNNEDSIALKVLAIDSIDQKTDTTLYIKFLKREVTPEKFGISITSSKLVRSQGQLFVQGTFTKPVTQINIDSLYIRLDSITTLPLKTENIHFNNQTKTFTIQQNFGKTTFAKKEVPETTPPETQKPKPEDINLILTKGAFMSVEKDSSNAIKQKLTPLNDEDLGIIKVKVITQTQNFILDLLTKDYKLVERRINPLNISFDNLNPGDYVLRITIDADNNKEWSPGNYYTKTEPEQFIYYINEKKSQTISLKANWEIGPLLIKF